MFATLFATSLPALAGDCNKVKFQFSNNTGAAIVVKSIDIDGNDGSWTENIKNKEIKSTRKHTTNKRRLNKLDSGQKAVWGINYDWLKAETNSWIPVKQVFRLYECNDNITMRFDLTSSKPLTN